MVARVELFIPETKDWCEIEGVEDGRKFVFRNYLLDREVEYVITQEGESARIKRSERLSPSVSGPVNIRTITNIFVGNHDRPYYVTAKTDKRPNTPRRIYRIAYV